MMAVYVTLNLGKSELVMWTIGIATGLSTLLIICDDSKMQSGSQSIPVHQIDQFLRSLKQIVALMNGSNLNDLDLKYHGTWNFF